MGVTHYTYSITTDSSGDGEVSTSPFAFSGFLLAAKIVPADGTTPSLTVFDTDGVALLEEDDPSGDPRRVPALNGAEPVDEQLTIAITGGGERERHKVHLYFANTAAVRNRASTQ